MTTPNLNVEISNIKVYIPNRSGHDFSDSQRYGSPIFVTSGEVNRFSVGHIARKWMQALENSSEKDYILLTSLTILTTIGAAIFGYLHGRINILIYRNGKYISRCIDIKELLQAQKESNRE